MEKANPKAIELQNGFEVPQENVQSEQETNPQMYLENVDGRGMRPGKLAKTELGNANDLMAVEDDSGMWERDHRLGCIGERNRAGHGEAARYHAIHWKQAWRRLCVCQWGVDGQPGRGAREGQGGRGAALRSDDAGCEILLKRR